MFENVAQQIIFDRLNGALSCNVWDTTPYLPEGMPATSFPYCVIGNDTLAAWDTDDTVGGDVTVTLHFWSRSNGKAEVKALMGEAYALLNRAVLTKAGYNIVDCLWQFSDVMDDPDGQTKHGVQRYRLTIQDV